LLSRNESTKRIFQKRIHKTNPQNESLKKDLQNKSRKRIFWNQYGFANPKPRIHMDSGLFKVRLCTKAVAPNLFWLVEHLSPGKVLAEHFRPKKPLLEHLNPKILHFCMNFKVSKNLTEHLGLACRTLVFRRTVVENHCTKDSSGFVRICCIHENRSNLLKISLQDESTKRIFWKH
jgi:hypothetical protein